MDKAEALNRQLFLFLNAGPGLSQDALGLSKFAAGGLVFLVPLLLAGLWLWGGDARRAAAFKALLTALLALALNTVIGWLWFHPRPEALHLGHTYISHAHDASFPSNHTTLMVAAAFALLAAAATWVFGAALLGLGLLTGWARIFLGVHFPLDVAGSLAVSAVACAVLAVLWPRCETVLMAPLLRLYRFACAPLIAAGWIKP